MDAISYNQLAKLRAFAVSEPKPVARPTDGYCPVCGGKGFTGGIYGANYSSCQVCHGQGWAK